MCNASEGVRSHSATDRVSTKSNAHDGVVYELNLLKEAGNLNLNPNLVQITEMGGAVDFPRSCV